MNRGGPWTVIHIDGGLDCNLEVPGVHSESAYAFIHDLAKENNGKVISFGCQSVRCSADELGYIKSKSGESISLSKIRSMHTPDDVKLASGIVLRTEAGKYLHKILCDAAHSPCMISWDFSSLSVSL